MAADLSELADWFRGRVGLVVFSENVKMEKEPFRQTVEMTKR